MKAVICPTAYANAPAMAPFANFPAPMKAEVESASAAMSAMRLVEEQCAALLRFKPPLIGATPKDGHG